MVPNMYAFMTASILTYKPLQTAASLLIVTFTVTFALQAFAFTFT